jgi:flagellar hook assembly protein FlgD
VQDIRGASIETPDLCFDLRAERAGNGSGRVYEVDQTTPAGEHRVTWNGVDQAGRTVVSGIYCVTISAGPTWKRVRSCH